jgi:hypothetical protein
MKNLVKAALITTATITSALGFGGCSNFFFQNVFNDVVNHPPEATPYFSVASLKVGESVVIGSNGTDLDGNEDIKSYWLNLDYSDERQEDEYFEKDSPFEVSCVPNYPGKIRLTGGVRDKEGEINAKSLEIEVLENTPEPIKDLRMDYFFQEYHKGGRFNYGFNLANQNPEGKTILIDSLKGGGIKLDLYKVGVESPVSTILVDQRLTLKLLNQGIFTTEVGNDSSTFTINEYCKALWEGLDFWIDGPVSINYPLGSTTFNENGRYYMETRMDYNFDGEEELNHLKLISLEFEVTE